MPDWFELVGTAAGLLLESTRLAEPTDVPPLSPARDPPYFKSRALRRRMAELEPPRSQTEMFGA